MDSQPFCRFLFMLIWIFVFFLHYVCSQKDSTLSLESRVFVALKGKNLTIHFNLMTPVNQSHHMLTCCDPAHKQIYYNQINSPKQHVQGEIMLKHLNMTGEYYCQYQTAKAYWFLYVRDDGFNVHAEDYTEFISVAVFTAVLLVFSVVGSVYVFRRHWIPCRQTDGKREENKGKHKEEKKKGKERKDDNINTITDSSTSFYASLEPRTGSIYDELHHSPANKKPEQQPDKPKKKETHQTKQATQHQEEGQFDSVYENY